MAYSFWRLCGKKVHREAALLQFLLVYPLKSGVGVWFALPKIRLRRTQISRPRIVFLANFFRDLAPFGAGIR
jgi:hypothetical protein